jgi:hypothetical protein
MGSNRGASREIFFKKKVSQGPWLTSSPICYFSQKKSLPTSPSGVFFPPKISILRMQKSLERIFQTFFAFENNILY